MIFLVVAISNLLTSPERNWLASCFSPPETNDKYFFVRVLNSEITRVFVRRCFSFWRMLLSAALRLAIVTANFNLLAPSLSSHFIARQKFPILCHSEEQSPRLRREASDEESIFIGKPDRKSTR